MEAWSCCGALCGFGSNLGLYKLTQQSGRQSRCSSTEYVIGSCWNGKSGRRWMVDKGLVAGCRPVRWMDDGGTDKSVC